MIDDDCLSYYYIFHYLSVKALQAHKKGAVTVETAQKKRKNS